MIDIRSQCVFHRMTFVFILYFIYEVEVDMQLGIDTSFFIIFKTIYFLVSALQKNMPLLKNLVVLFI